MQDHKFRENAVLRLSFEFSVALVQYCDLLIADKHYVLAKQLFRSGTSIGANLMEAQNAESRIDFLHKVKIAAKESDETQYWLLICSYSPNYPACDNLQTILVSLQKLITAILSSTRKNIEAYKKR